MPLDQITNEDLEKHLKDPDAEDIEASEMSFLDHLEQLRWHLIRGLAAVVVFMVIAFINGPWVFHHIILAPARPDFWTYKQMCAAADWLNSPALCIDSMNFIIQNRTLSGQFMMHITASVMIGLVCAFPYVFWELWRFIRPGLYKKEQKAARGASVYVSFLFLLGVFFGYYIVAPLSINFLSSYQIDPSIQNEIDITSYVSTLLTLVLACAFLFQLPIVVFFLARVGLISPKFMRTYRRHAIVIILVISAIITPPDVFSQVLISIPLSLLYELSIGIAARVEKKYFKEAAKA